MTKKELLEQLEDFPDSTEIYVDNSEREINRDKDQVIKDVITKTTDGVSIVYLRRYIDERKNKVHTTI